MKVFASYCFLYVRGYTNMAMHTFDLKSISEGIIYNNVAFSLHF